MILKTYERCRGLTVLYMITLWVPMIPMLSLIFESRGEPLSWLFFLMNLVLYVFFLTLLNIFLTCKHTLVVTSDGLFYEELVKRIGIGFVPWEEVVRATTYRGYEGTGYVKLELKEGVFLENIQEHKKAHKHLSGNSIFISVSFLGSGIDQNCQSSVYIRWRMLLGVLRHNYKANIICTDINKAVNSINL